MVTTRSPFCGHNTTQRVELKGKDLLRYSNKTESVSHWLTKKRILSAVTVTNIYQSFYRQNGGKNQLA